MKRQMILFWLILFSFLKAFSGAEYLPEKMSEAEKEEAIQVVRSRLPWAMYNNISYVDMQINGLKALRKRFPEFDKWAQEKPDPITITIDKETVDTRTVSVLNAEQLRALRQDLKQNMDSIQEQHKDLNAETLRTLVFKELGGLLTSASNESPRGVLTGLIHTLPNEEKGPLFKLADPAAQLEKLKSLQLTDEALRASAFRFETVGLTPETATVKKVLDLVQARLNTQSRIVDLTVLARVISDMSIEDLKQVLANERPSEILAARLRDSDFDFVTDKNSSFLKNLQMHLSVETSVASEQFKKPIEMMTSSFPKTWFYSEQRQMTQTVPYLKVIEVHPYLAVHRGCIGGDCSTWASPMFSYSPWEHVFFIQSPDGSFVGYVSATRLTVDGKAVLYLKDLSGAQLSAEIAEQVLTAFRSTLSHFKVEKLYIASPEFTDSQNHYENLIGMFRKYNRKKAQTLHFLDLPVRKYIQKTDIFRSSSSYDSAASHRTGVEFFADPQITKGLNISYQSGTLKPFQPQTPKASLLFALAMLANDPEANLRQIPDLDVAEVRALAALLKNPEKMALAKYYESIKNQFQKYGIELSRSFRLANDTLFYAGHIRASDAFSTENETLRNDSEKFLSQFSRLHKDLFVTLEVVKKWTAYLNGSERFNELVALYRERATLRDVLSLYGFANAGIKSAQKAIEEPAIQAKLEPALAEFLTRYPKEKISQIVAGRESPFYRILTLVRPTDGQLTVSEYKTRLASALTDFDLKPDALTNPTLIALLQEARIKTAGGINRNTLAADTPFIQHRLQSGQISNPEFIVLLKANPDAINSNLTKSYVETLIQDPIPKNVYTLLLLSALKEKKAKEALLKSPQVRENFNVLIGQLMQAETSDPDIRTLISEASNANIVYSWLEFGAQLRSLAALANRSHWAPDKSRLSPETYNISLDELLKFESFQKVYAEVYVTSRNAFSNGEFPANRVYDFLKAEMKGDPNGQSNLFAKAMVGQIRQDSSFLKEIKDKPETKAFLKQIEVAALKEGCGGCLMGWVQAVSLGLRQDSISKSDQAFVERMLSHPNPIVVAYGVRQVFLNFNKKIRVTDEHILKVSELLGADRPEMIKTLKPIFAELAIDAMIRYPTQSPRLQEILKQFVTLEKSDPNLVLKASSAFVLCGGNKREISPMVRSRVPVASSLSEGTKAWYDYYQGLMKDSGLITKLFGKKSSGQSMSCRAVHVR